MLTIDIDRVTTRYRLPATAAGQRSRLQRVIDDALRRVLEGELERQGIDPAAYVCVDAVHTVVPLRLGQADETLADVAGHAIAGAIQDALADGSASVVRFSSRAHLLADAAASALAGDFSRSWAWTQAGVWRSDGAMGTDAAANHVLRMLTTDAIYAVGVLGFLARTHPDRLQRLLSRAAPRMWETLAHAVLSAAQGGHRRPQVPEHSIRTDAAVHREYVASIATRVATDSALARTAFARWPALPDQTRRSVIVLAVLDTDPSAARHALELAGALTAIWSRDDAVDDPGPQQQAVRPNDSTRVDSAGSHRAATDPARHGRPVLEHGEHRRDRSGDAAVRRDERTQDLESTVNADTTGAPVDVRTRVSTRHGGLLYLVNLLPQIGSIEAIEADTQWASRGMRWVLHQLAMQLASLEPDDPAALVFAGVQPDAPVPSALQAPPTSAEHAALAAMSHRIAAALYQRLGRDAAADGEDRQDVLALLRDVIERPAAILAEPAWIEARFALGDVSIEIRRAGLDLNPGWVPWLGIVLRFVYE